MQTLNFPLCEFRFKSSENKRYTIHFLLKEKHYPQSLMSVEKRIYINHLTKRYDIVIYRSDGSIFLVVECKAPQVAITQEVFDQIARYNMQLQAENLMITNGLQHIFYQVDLLKQAYVFLRELPEF